MRHPTSRINRKTSQSTKHVQQRTVAFVLLELAPPAVILIPLSFPARRVAVTSLLRVSSAGLMAATPGGGNRTIAERHKPKIVHNMARHNHCLNQHRGGQLCYHHSSHCCHRVLASAAFKAAGTRYSGTLACNQRQHDNRTRHKR